jgi:hypothetical protein
LGLLEGGGGVELNYWRVRGREVGRWAGGGGCGSAFYCQINWSSFCGLFYSFLITGVPSGTSEVAIKSLYPADIIGQPLYRHRAIRQYGGVSAAIKCVQIKG